jgi:hypothetical protein
MLGAMFVVMGLLMFALCFVPQIGRAVNMLYISAWLICAIVVLSMGICLWVLT